MLTDFAIAMHGYYAWTAQGRDVRRVAGGLVLVAAVTGVYFLRRDRVRVTIEAVRAVAALGSWSGRGNAQTGSFPSVTGSMRVLWRTDHELLADAGTFRLTIHSAISGRPLSWQSIDRVPATTSRMCTRVPHLLWSR